MQTQRLGGIQSAAITQIDNAVLPTGGDPPRLAVAMSRRFISAIRLTADRTVKTTERFGHRYVRIIERHIARGDSAAAEAAEQMAAGPSPVGNRM